MVQLTGVLRSLYQKQLEKRPEDEYLRHHCQPSFLAGTTYVFRFYEPYLPSVGRVLEWGCHHAPDGCLIRLCRPDLEIDGCDIFEAERYPVFFEYARLRYQRLQDIVCLPYPDSSFDVVIASGVLEHVPMDYESLKEIRRVCRPGGKLVITYLPNRASVEEWYQRRNSQVFHARLYSRTELHTLLLHTGFVPLAIGYQTRLDALPRDSGAFGLLRLLGLHRLTSCLCAIAAKRDYL